MTINVCVALTFCIGDYGFFYQIKYWYSRRAKLCTDKTPWKTEDLQWPTFEEETARNVTLINSRGTLELIIHQNFYSVTLDTFIFLLLRWTIRF